MLSAISNIYYLAISLPDKVWSAAKNSLEEW
jgi:hypothetical protein